MPATDPLSDVQARLPHPVGPPPRPNRKKWPFVGTLVFQGILIHVEQRPGDERTGENDDGTRWSTIFTVSYGEIAGSNRGTDGDRVDVFVGPHQDATHAFVIRETDQDKVMLGFRDAKQARAVWADHYDQPPVVAEVLTLTMAQLHKWLAGPAKGRVMSVAEMIESVRSGEAPEAVLTEATLDEAKVTLRSVRGERLTLPAKSAIRALAALPGWSLRGAKTSLEGTGIIRDPAAWKAIQRATDQHHVRSRAERDRQSPEKARDAAWAKVAKLGLSWGKDLVMDRVHDETRDGGTWDRFEADSWAQGVAGDIGRSLLDQLTRKERAALGTDSAVEEVAADYLYDGMSKALKAHPKVK